MIEGLKLTMTSAELKKTLESRVEYHQGRVAWLTVEIKRLEPELAKFTEQSLEIEKYVSNSSNNGLDTFKSQLRHHTDRATVFKFMAEHIIPNETYLLEEEDLRRLEVLPRW